MRDDKHSFAAGELVTRAPGGSVVLYPLDPEPAFILGSTVGDPGVCFIVLDVTNFYWLNVLSSAGYVGTVSSDSLVHVARADGMLDAGAM